AHVEIAYKGLRKFAAECNVIDLVSVRIAGSQIECEAIGVQALQICPPDLDGAGGGVVEDDDRRGDRTLPLFDRCSSAGVSMDIANHGDAYAENLGGWTRGETSPAACARRQAGRRLLRPEEDNRRGLECEAGDRLGAGARSLWKSTLLIALRGHIHRQLAAGAARGSDRVHATQVLVDHGARGVCNLGRPAPAAREVDKTVSGDAAIIDLFGFDQDSSRRV